VAVGWSLKGNFGLGAAHLWRSAPSRRNRGCYWGCPASAIIPANPVDLNTVDRRRAPATSKPCRIECRRFAIAGSPGGRIAFIPAWNDNGAGRFSCDRSEPGARAGKKAASRPAGALASFRTAAYSRGETTEHFVSAWARGSCSVRLQTPPRCAPPPAGCRRRPESRVVELDKASHARLHVFPRLPPATHPAQPAAQGVRGTVFAGLARLARRIQGIGAIPIAALRDPLPAGNLLGGGHAL
jgi:hypothetical protein